MQKLDVLITGSSRPECLKVTIESFLTQVQFSGEFRFLMHEDAVYRRMSDKVKDYVNLQDGLFKVFVFDYPHIGLGKSIGRMLDHIESDFMFYLQDDWKFERLINLDKVIAIMKANADIRQIWFNKNKNFKQLKGWEFTERKEQGETLCLNDLWCMLPAVWRTETIKKKAHVFNSHSLAWPIEGHITRCFGGSPEQREVPSFCKKMIGSYRWGPVGDYRQIVHLGDDLQMQFWQRKQGRPGSNKVDPIEIDGYSKHPDVVYTERPDITDYKKVVQFNVWLRQGFVDISDYFSKTDYPSVDWSRAKRWAIVRLEPTGLKQSYVERLLIEVLDFSDGYNVGLVVDLIEITKFSGEKEPAMKLQAFRKFLSKRLEKSGFKPLKASKYKLFRYPVHRQYIYRDRRNLVLGLPKPLKG